MTNAGSTPIRVLVVDDDAIVRRSLAADLAADSELEVVGTCADGAEALSFVLANPPDVVLMDVNLPGMDGPAAIDAMRQAKLPTRAIALASLDDEVTVRRVLSAGGLGLLPKTAPHRSIVSAVKLAAEGSLVILPSYAVRSLARGAVEKPPVLNERQLEMLRLLATGHRSEAIARALNLSLSTIKTEQRLLGQTFGVRGRVALATRAQQLGLL